jgi:peroxiredoxin
MVKTYSTMLELGTAAPDFRLPNTNAGAGKPEVSLADFDDAPALLVAFVCNHCPYVKHIREGFVRFANEYRKKGLAVVAVSSNDVAMHPDDAPDKMAQEAAQYAFPYPYLYDETQDVAKRYQAACTPDLFLFDRNRRLVYRGRFDDSTPGNQKPVTGADLRAAADAVLAGRPVSGDQAASMGCNIKWKAGNEPEYFPAN